MEAEGSLLSSQGPPSGSSLSQVNSAPVYRSCDKHFVTFHIASIHATYPVQLILIDLIVQIIFSEQYTWWSFSLNNFIQPFVT
jgi:hypothetical protein